MPLSRDRSLQKRLASRQRTRSTGLLGLSCQCEGSGNCTLANISWVTSNWSIQNALSFTLCAGASSGLPRSLPIVNSPADTKTRGPHWVARILASELAFELPPSFEVAGELPDGCFSHPAKAAPIPSRRISRSIAKRESGEN